MWLEIFSCSFNNGIPIEKSFLHTIRTNGMDI
jgi:hypothetical protein